MEALRWRTALAGAAALLMPALAAAAPLDLANTAARTIQVEIETSADPAVVGTTFGPPLPATYSVSGGVGTIVIADEDYEAFVGAAGLDISNIVLRIELATRAVEVVSAIGTFSLPFGGYSFLWSMDTSRTAGFVDASGLPQLLCSSQAEVDALCPAVPQLCGATCVLVPGAAYDPATGKLNMVGFERQSGCGETGCLVFDMFNKNGDLRLSEVSSQAVPATGPVAAAALAALLMLLAVRRLRAGATRRQSSPRSASTRSR